MIYFIYHLHSFLSREHMNPQLTCSQRQWLHSSVGRASHRYREVTGSNPVEVLNFFQASLRNCINCVHCDDHFFIFVFYFSCTRSLMLELSTLKELQTIWKHRNIATFVCRCKWRKLTIVQIYCHSFYPTRTERPFLVSSIQGNSFLCTVSYAGTLWKHRDIPLLLSLRSRRLEVVGKKTTGAREGDTPRMSPSRAPVLSFAHYFQAPATQAMSCCKWCDNEPSSRFAVALFYPTKRPFMVSSLQRYFFLYTVSYAGIISLKKQETLWKHCDIPVPCKGRKTIVKVFLALVISPIP